MTPLTDKEKDRLIELLLEAFECAGESEGIYFSSHADAIEIMEFEKRLNPSEERRKQLDMRIEYLKKIDG